MIVCFSGSFFEQNKEKIKFVVAISCQSTHWTYHNQQPDFDQYPHIERYGYRNIDELPMILPSQEFGLQPIQAA